MHIFFGIIDLFSSYFTKLGKYIIGCDAVHKKEKYGTTELTDIPISLRAIRQNPTCCRKIFLRMQSLIKVVEKYG